MTPRILVLNGPNLNLLGKREPQLYGTDSLVEIEKQLQHTALEKGVNLNCFQSNAEHELIERIHLAAQEFTHYILFNPAAFTHTSIALRDALLATGIPFIEIHLSNLFAREPMRQKSFFSDIAQGLIAGLGSLGYVLALEAALSKIRLPTST